MTEGSVSGGVMRREVNASLEARIAERAQERSTTWLLSPDLLGALNSEGHITTSNPAWQSMLGWPEAEVVSMSIFELLHPDEVEQTRDGGFATGRSLIKPLERAHLGAYHAGVEGPKQAQTGENVGGSRNGDKLNLLRRNDEVLRSRSFHLRRKRTARCQGKINLRPGSG